MRNIEKEISKDIKRQRADEMRIKSRADKAAGNKGNLLNNTTRRSKQKNDNVSGLVISSFSSSLSFLLSFLFLPFLILFTSSSFAFLPSSLSPFFFPPFFPLPFFNLFSFYLFKLLFIFYFLCCLLCPFAHLFHFWFLLISPFFYFFLPRVSS